MKGLRHIFAALACFAAVLTGAPAFAAAFSHASHQEVATADGASKCDDCPDCSAPCTNVVDCVAPCAMALPALAVASIEPHPFVSAAPKISNLTDRLIGERPPPDPLPPRR